MSYKVLLLGSGGREHALALKIAQSPELSEFYALPGNPGISKVARCIKGSVNDFELVKSIVKEKTIDMVVVGPEDPLVNGLRDYLLQDESLENLLFIGPGKDGAALEGSKDFAKEFMTKYNIPTAHYRTFTSDQADSAKEFLESLRPPYVLKADGLAAGKGVLIINDISEAEKGIDEIFSGKFGSAGDKLVIEQFLSGVELSCFVLTDGKDYLMLPEAKDYKRAHDNDEGLNTGGMGSVSPVPFADSEFLGKVEERIVKPTIAGLRAENIDYRGFIFIGLMNCNGDPYVIEYNVRMGDPETESVMTRIDSDFLEHLAAAASGTISTQKIKISSHSAVTVIVVSGGYPEHYAKGYEIKGLDSLEDITLYHAGTSEKEGKVVTSGGRVLAVTANGDSLKECRDVIYSQIDKIAFTDSYHRGDIALDMIGWNR